MAKGKKELEEELNIKDQLLKDILFALNQIRRTKVSGKFEDTYAICTEIQKLLK